MTYGARGQCKFSLSVRTRALLQKFHERAIKRQRLFTRSCSEMRLRTRMVPASSSIVLKSSVADAAPTLPTTVNSNLNCEPNIASGSLYPNAVNAEPIAATNNSNHESSSVYSTDSTETTSISLCKWEKCGATVHQSQLVSHIQHTHVLPQLVSNRRKCFTCLWQGCRVFRLPSVSAAWLENHILHHTDAKGKPFRCIFDGCNVRFSTSFLLERHVQRVHTPSSPKGTLSSGHSAQLAHGTSTTTIPETADPSPRYTNKQLVSPNQSAKKNLRRRKKARGYRVRRVDFYDRRTQCVINHRLRLCKLLCSGDANGLMSSLYSNVTANGAEPTHSAPLPRPLMRSPTRPILRSSASGAAKFLPQKIASVEKRRHLALLLSNPHTFVGQRLSNDNHLEVLVRWSDIHGLCSSTVTWIPYDEVLAAIALSTT